MAFAAVVAFALLMGIAYLVYKKLFHGTKTLSKKQWMTTILLLGWLAVVLGLTFSRGADDTGKINLALFSGYKNAWNQWSLLTYLFILFRVLLFSPLGFLLPFLTKKRGEALRCLPGVFPCSIVDRSFAACYGVGNF